MKYEKAETEIIVFQNENIFMTSSTNITGCDIYTAIASICGGFSGNPADGEFICEDFNDGLPYPTSRGTFLASGQGGKYFMCYVYE